ncbi:MAG TPA: (d)CMP kinase [Solirubrobacterales bacterium]|nr:(d)CMP kinase [Solirubrobacterales bacterium]
MSPDFDLRRLVVRLARAQCDFVVIGSSALALQEWEVMPTDLDVMTDPAGVDAIVAALEVGDAQWVKDGAARRLECSTTLGPVDVYTAVSGGLGYATVIEDAVPILIEGGELSVRVGSLEHVRDMRAAVGRADLPIEAVAPAAKHGAPRVVAIDGPAGAGKSTVARSVAEQLDLTYLDTGAMYRCVTLAVCQCRADTDDREEIGRIASTIPIEFGDGRVLLDGEDVSDAIRAAEVTEMTPHIAAYPEVRKAMIERQREFFSHDGYVAEGRDTGTVVAPDAPLKIYLTATPEERARRRSLETGGTPHQVQAALEVRDELDSNRELSALRVAEDAVVVDTTGRSIEDVVAEIATLAAERGVA